MFCFTASKLPILFLLIKIIFLKSQEGTLEARKKFDSFGLHIIKFLTFVLKEQRD